MSTKIPVLPMVLDLPWALCTRFVHPPSARPFSAKSFHLSLSLFLGLSKNGKKNVFKSNVYQTNFLTKQKTAEVTACESP